MQHAAYQAEAPALVDAGGMHSYASLKSDILHVCSCLEAAGIRQGDRLVFECTQDEMFLACSLACSLQGVIFVGVERRATADRLREVVRETKASMLIIRRAKSAAGLFSPDEEDTPEVMAVNEFLALSEGKEADYELPSPDRIHEILFSTGTTGKSKGVMLSNRANAANAENIISGTQMHKDAVELMPLPLNHAHGLRTAYAHLVNGSTCVIANGITLPRLILNMMEQYRVNAMDLTPSAASMLLETAGEKLHALSDRIQYVEVGAAFLPESTKQALRECFPKSRLYNFYGSSESGRTCVLDFNIVKDKPGCIGKPVPNATFAIMDPDNGGHLQTDREHTGLLACAGPMNMSGYWGEEGLTESVLKNGYVLTADLAYMDEEGYLYVLGRQDDVINYQGIKISPDEIESAAMQSGMLADCACVPVSDPLAGQVPKLCVVPAEGRQFSDEELLKYLREHIDANRMPRHIERIPEVPRTYNGKIQRKKLM